MDNDLPCNDNDDDDDNDQAVTLLHWSNGVIFKKNVRKLTIQSRKLLKIITEKDSCYFIHGKMSQ